MKVFLGGTCNGSNWRDYVIKNLNVFGIDYFNPIVDDWNEEAVKREEAEKLICDVNLYVITPEMSGVYSIAEAVNESHTKPGCVIFCVLKEWGGKSFDEGQLRSFDNVGKIINRNGSSYLKCLDKVMMLLSTYPIAEKTGGY